MAIDLRQVEPLGSKSVLLEQALRRQKANGELEGVDADIDMSDMVEPDFQWLNEDKSALKNLVSQMDASIGSLAKQMKDLELESSRLRMKIDKEQQLLFKQIRTLNNLLKNQINIYTSVETKIEDINIQQNQFVPQIGIGIMAGLMSAITILATAPWMTLLMENLRA